MSVNTIVKLLTATRVIFTCSTFCSNSALFFFFFDSNLSVQTGLAFFKKDAKASNFSQMIRTQCLLPKPRFGLKSIWPHSALVNQAQKTKSQTSHEEIMKNHDGCSFQISNRCRIAFSVWLWSSTDREASSVVALNGHLSADSSAFLATVRSRRVASDDIFVYVRGWELIERRGFKLL